MKISLRSILVFAAVAALVLVLFLRFDRANAHAAALAALSAERDDLRQQLVTAHSQLRDWERKDARRGAESFASFQPADEGGAGVHQAGAPGAVFEFATAGGAPRDGQRPEWLDEQMKTHLRRRYEPLLQRLGVPPERADALATLLLEKQSTAMDILDAARGQGIDFDPAKQNPVQALLKAADAAIDERTRGLLGDDAYQQYRHFEETLPHRATVEQLAGTLALTAQPMSRAQSEQLLEILAANAPVATQSTTSAGAPGPMVGMATTFGGGMLVAGPVTTMGGAPITDGAVNEAREILTPTQLAALQQLQSDQAAARRMMETMQKDVPPLPGRAPPGRG